MVLQRWALAILAMFFVQSSIMGATPPRNRLSPQHWASPAELAPHAALLEKAAVWNVQGLSEDEVIYLELVLPAVKSAWPAQRLFVRMVNDPDAEVVAGAVAYKGLASWELESGIYDASLKVTVEPLYTGKQNLSFRFVAETNDADGNPQTPSFEIKDLKLDLGSK